MPKLGIQLQMLLDQNIDFIPLMEFRRQVFSPLIL
jgi:hypothetical protein